MAKKTLLTEGRVRRFMQLAGNANYSKNFIKEGAYQEEEDLEEELDLFEQDPEAIEGGEDDIPPPEEGGEEAEDVDALDDLDSDAPDDVEEADDVDVTVDEEQIAALRTAVEVLQDIIEASDGDAEEDAEEPGEEEFAMGGEEDALGDEAPPETEFAMGGEEEEESPGAIAESVNNITKRVLNRVTKRLVAEALKR